MVTLEPIETSTALLDGDVTATDGAGSANVGVSEKSSTARPSSAPDALKSTQRIQKVAPAAIDTPETWPTTDVRFARALPSSAPMVGPVVGAVKSSASTFVHVPVVRLV